MWTKLAICSLAISSGRSCGDDIYSPDTLAYRRRLAETELPNTSTGRVFRFGDQISLSGGNNEDFSEPLYPRLQKNSQYFILGTSAYNLPFRNVYYSLVDSDSKKTTTFPKKP